MVLMCYLISKGHMIKGSWDFIGGSHSAKFGGQRHSSSGDIMFTVFQVIFSQNQVNFLVYGQDNQKNRIGQLAK